MSLRACSLMTLCIQTIGCFVFSVRNSTDVFLDVLAAFLYTNVPINMEYNGQICRNAIFCYSRSPFHLRLLSNFYRKYFALYLLGRKLHRMYRVPHPLATSFLVVFSGLSTVSGLNTKLIKINGYGEKTQKT